MRHGMRTGIGLVCGGQANNGDRRPVSQPGKVRVMQAEGEVLDLREFRHQ